MTTLTTTMNAMKIALTASQIESIQDRELTAMRVMASRYLEESFAMEAAYRESGNVVDLELARVFFEKYNLISNRALFVSSMGYDQFIEWYAVQVVNRENRGRN